MFALLFASLLFLNTGHALQCIFNCSIGNQFDVPFKIPDGQCQQRASWSDCGVSLNFQYGQQSYSVGFGKFSSSYDFFTIFSVRTATSLYYTIYYRCSTNTDCNVLYAQNRIDEMIARNYDARRIYGQLAPLIDNPSRNDSIQCYDLKNNVVTCSSSEVCSLEFDTRGKKIKSRGCKTERGPRVFGSDGNDSPSLNVECTRNLCNGDTTLTEIKSILAENGVTDADGRRIAAGTKEIASSLSVTLAFIFALVSYF